MKIGNIDLGDSPVMLAPMEDVTDESFRLICKEMGADMTYTEFVSADAPHTQYSGDHPQTKNQSGRKAYCHSDIWQGSGAYG